jgi:hypothetical protein
MRSGGGIIRISVQNEKYWKTSSTTKIIKSELFGVTKGMQKNEQEFYQLSRFDFTQPILSEPG